MNIRKIINLMGNVSVLIIVIVILITLLGIAFSLFTGGQPLVEYKPIYSMILGTIIIICSLMCIIDFVGSRYIVD